MKKAKIGAFFALSVLAFGAVAGSALAINGDFELIEGAEQSACVLNFGVMNKLTTINDTAYSQSGTLRLFYTSYDTSNNRLHVKLNDGGTIYTDKTAYGVHEDGTWGSVVNGLESVAVSYTGTLKIVTSYTGEFNDAYMQDFDNGVFNCNPELPAPRYFKLVAVGDVEIKSIRIECSMELHPDVSLPVGMYKGMVHYYDYSEGVPYEFYDVLVDVKSDLVVFKQVVGGQLEDLILYPVKDDFGTISLVADLDDPSALIYQLSEPTYGLNITCDNDLFMMEYRNGQKFVACTELTIEDEGNSITSLELDFNKEKQLSAKTNFGCTEEVTWSVDNANVEIVSTKDKTVTIKGVVENSTAVLTAKCGDQSASLTLKIKSQSETTSLPSELKGVELYFSDDVTGFGITLTVILNDDNTMVLTDDMGYCFSDYECSFTLTKTGDLLTITSEPDTSDSYFIIEYQNGVLTIKDDFGYGMFVGATCQVI